MADHISDVGDQILALWEALKPKEATSARFIAMDEASAFAGQPTVG
jgi:hypothetical protein